jgi:fatty acid synthase subunit alpha
MISVNGLLLKDFQPHISKMNKYLPDNSQISVPLHNGPRTFIVTGPPRALKAALYGLDTNLRKIRASNGSDQSKVEFSKRKPAFGARFLVFLSRTSETLQTRSPAKTPSRRARSSVCAR